MLACRCLWFRKLALVLDVVNLCMRRRLVSVTRTYDDEFHGMSLFSINRNGGFEGGL